MSKTHKLNKGGRPSVETESINVRMHKKMFEKIDEWRRNQADLPNRQEAIRRILGGVLIGPGEKHHD